MKDHRPGIFDRHVEHDEASILAALKQSCYLNRLAMPKRNDLAQFLAISESDDLQWDRQVNVGLGHQGGEHRSHLLKTLGNLAAALFSRIGHHREVRRVDFEPLQFGGESARSNK